MTTEDPTTWDERREFEERLFNGQGLTSSETARLIDDADTGERATAKLEGLEKALKAQMGLIMVDVTTDDDGDEIRIDLVKAEEESDER